MIATPFGEGGEVDEQALRMHLRRVVSAGCGVYLGSPGSGEGHTLSVDELRRVYEIGVEECRGRVWTGANVPEQRSAARSLAMCKVAAEAGVDIVQVYQLDGGHGMRPTVSEQERFYDTVLGGLDHTIALSVHALSGYVPPVSLITRLAERYPQVRTLNLVQVPAPYFVAARDAVGDRLVLNVHLVGVIEGLALGATGYQSAEANVAPNLARAVTERFAAGDLAGAADAFAHLTRLGSVLDQWAPSSARPIKMALKALQLPGGNGAIRPPYLLPPAAELERMRELLDATGFAAAESAAGR
jgi:dihydrodipicolinate synthase/N-acetylneuraminate lyase